MPRGADWEARKAQGEAEGEAEEGAEGEGVEGEAEEGAEERTEEGAEGEATEGEERTEERAMAQKHTSSAGWRAP